jgi:hypothetical protein
MAGIIAAKSRRLKVFLPIGPDFVFGPATSTSSALMAGFR